MKVVFVPDERKVGLATEVETVLGYRFAKRRFVGIAPVCARCWKRVRDDPFAFEYHMADGHTGDDRGCLHAVVAGGFDSVCGVRVGLRAWDGSAWGRPVDLYRPPHVDAPGPEGP